MADELQEWVVARISALQVENTLVEDSLRRWQKLFTAEFAARHLAPVDDLLFPKWEGKLRVPDLEGDFDKEELLFALYTAAYEIVLHHPDQLDQPNMGFLHALATMAFHLKLGAAAHSHEPTGTRTKLETVLNIGLVGERLGLWTNSAYIPE